MDQPVSARFSVGLTGGIGCGKTTVANLFGELGVALIDTDEIAHALTAPGGAAMDALIDAFGAGVATPDGALDRARMRNLVFTDPQARQRLEAVLHPRISAAALAAAATAGGHYLMYVVPLLVESGTWKSRVTRVLAIDCPEEIQVARVMARNGLPEKQVRDIMANQATRQQRLLAADDVLTNDGDIAALRPQINRLHGIYMAFSEKMSRIRMERL